MNTSNYLRFLALFLLSAVSFSCQSSSGLDDEYKGPFWWTITNSKFIYNYRLVADTSLTVWGIKIENRDSTLSIIFKRIDNVMHPTQFLYTWDTIPDGVIMTPVANYSLMDAGLTLGSNGLERDARERCNNEFSKRFYFLRVPSNPYAGQILPQYRCEHKPDGYFKVVEINKQVTVSAGTYNTFVIEDENKTEREYWNADHGIIKLESLKKDGSTFGYYELAKIEY